MKRIFLRTDLAVPGSARTLGERKINLWSVIAFLDCVWPR